MKTVAELIKEAGIKRSSHYEEWDILKPTFEQLERFATLVREDEREQDGNCKCGGECIKCSARVLAEREKQQEPVAWVKAKELAIAKSLSDDGYAKQWSTTLGFKKEDGDIPLYTTQPTIEAAVLAEREACAKVCESLFDMDDDSCNEAEQCVEAIRARSE